MRLLFWRRRRCLHCEVKEQRIAELREELLSECDGCLNKDNFLAFLQTQLAKAEHRSDVERDEWKRALDVALMVQGKPPVGQGKSPEEKPSASLKDLSNMIDAEVRIGKNGEIEARQLTREELDF